MFRDISGVILAGGKSSRFGGQPKTKIIIGGNTILSKILRIFGGLFGEVIIVTNTPDEYSEFKHYRIIRDLLRDMGPLGGLHAAMKATTKSALFVVAGDMPFLEEDLIIRQIRTFNEELCEAVIPVVNNFPEPLHAILSTSVLDKLEKHLTTEDDCSVMSFIKKLDVRYMKIPPSDPASRVFTNINSPSDLAEFYP